MLNALFDPYHLGLVHCHFAGHQEYFIISFFDEIHDSKQNSSNGTLRFAASHLRLICLTMSHKKDAMLKYELIYLLISCVVVLMGRNSSLMIATVLLMICVKATFDLGHRKNKRHFYPSFLLF